MKLSDIIASVGVIILLIAFFLNLNQKIKSDSKLYIWCNIIGAGMNCYASYMISFYPFFVLEAIWTGVAIFSLFKNVPRGTSND
ncbi:CBU_0592 family membrane protein [Mucilaginibacter paludis]|uniref:CBU-0592-like domain-containing protein n=1 Tax=Mucilaginibacter paludis DSM 18603 TaxID=714943 RepID=H1YG67_9SPHI|nr:hypothetical protein Mucpa_3227 [Mucilaginibacter paludis DSM 18603]